MGEIIPFPGGGSARNRAILDFVDAIADRMEVLLHNHGITRRQIEIVAENMAGGMIADGSEYSRDVFEMILAHEANRSRIEEAFKEACRVRGFID